MQDAIYIQAFYLFTPVSELVRVEMNMGMGSHIMWNLTEPVEILRRKVKQSK